MKIPDGSANFLNLRLHPETILLVIAIVGLVLVAGCSTLQKTPTFTGSQPGSGSGPVSPSIPVTVITIAATNAPSGGISPWSGTWNSDWGMMQLMQSGNQVTATYTHDQGRIMGTVSGNILTGTWSESPSYQPPDDAGDLILTMAPDGNTFTGNWRYGTNTGRWDGTWNAWK